MSRLDAAFIGTVPHGEARCRTCGDGKVEMVVNRYGEWVYVPCTKCVSPLPKNWLMKPPSKLDGSRILVCMMPDGRVFVDVKPEQAPSYGKLISKYVVGDYIMNRGGPEHSRHFCRFEDYGLADGMLRCKKCGLVKEAE